MRRNSGHDGQGNAWPGQAWLSRFAGAGWLQRAGQGEWDILWFLVSSRFLRRRDLRDLDFTRGKPSYRCRRRRRLCKILIFLLHSPLLSLLSLIVESIISCFWYDIQSSPSFKVLYWTIIICNFMDSIWEVMNWVIALTVQGSKRVPQRVWREGLLREKSWCPDPDIVLITLVIS